MVSLVTLSTCRVTHPRGCPVRRPPVSHNSCNSQVKTAEMGFLGVSAPDSRSYAHERRGVECPLARVRPVTVTCYLARMLSSPPSTPWEAASDAASTGRVAAVRWCALPSVGSTQEIPPDDCSPWTWKCSLEQHQT